MRIFTAATSAARPVTQADLATVIERVRRRVIRWFKLLRLLDASAAADMLDLTECNMETCPAITRLMEAAGLPEP